VTVLFGATEAPATVAASLRLNCALPVTFSAVAFWLLAHRHPHDRFPCHRGFPPVGSKSRRPPSRVCRTGYRLLSALMTAQGWCAV